MHGIEAVLLEIEHLKKDVKESIQDFKDHTEDEKTQFLKLEKQHLDLIGIIGRLTTTIEVGITSSTTNFKWFKTIGGLLFTGTAIALAFLFFRQIEIITNYEALKKECQHEVDKDAYYDKNRKTIFEMIERYKLKRIKG